VIWSKISAPVAAVRPLICDCVCVKVIWTFLNLVAGQLEGKRSLLTRFSVFFSSFKSKASEPSRVSLIALSVRLGLQIKASQLNQTRFCLLFKKCEGQSASFQTTLSANVRTIERSSLYTDFALLVQSHRSLSNTSPLTKTIKSCLISIYRFRSRGHPKVLLRLCEPLRSKTVTTNLD
jgi:hypothetical protein